MKKIKSAIKRFFHKTTSEKLTYIIYFIFFTVMSLVFLFPIYSALLTSFQSIDAEPGLPRYFWQFFVINGTPQTNTWQNIVDVFNITTSSGYYQNLLDMLFNSIWFTLAKTFLSLLASFLLAYAVAKFNFPGKNLIYLLAVFVQTIPIFGTGAASYKLFDSLNMINNPLLFWVAWVTGFDFSFIILHGALKGLSNSYSEAARIDGANNLTIFLKIIIPMMAPVLLALFIANSLGVWNDYATIQVYLHEYPTLSYGLYEFRVGTAQEANQQAVLSAATLISAVPIIIIYSLSQKLILTNISVGGLKG